MLKDLQKLYLRELHALKKEVMFFLDDELLWKKPEGITNSAGNIILHVCGNLRHFIGSVLGNTGYVRNREYEFSATGLDRNKLIEELNLTITDIESVLPKISEHTLEEIYPLKVADASFTVGIFLIHLEAHLAFHVGQMGYLRRIVCEDNRSTNPLSVKELHED